jgi:hypothetical protein
MKQFYILGQRVNTYKFGLGTVVGFEDLRNGSRAVIQDHQSEWNDRIIVKLDNPQSWLGYSEKQPDPYMMQRDIVKE